MLLGTVYSTPQRPSAIDRKIFTACLIGGNETLLMHPEKESLGDCLVSADTAMGASGTKHA